MIIFSKRGAVVRCLPLNFFKNMKTLELKYIEKDRFDREIFLAPAGTIHKTKPVYLVDVEMDYEFHHGRKLCTIAMEKGCNNPYYGEPDCPISKEWDITVTNDKERRQKNENPYKKVYMMLDRMRSDCEYHIGYARMNGAKPIEDIEKHIRGMKELWNSLPEDGKPEWLSMEGINELEKMLKSDKVYLLNAETMKLEEKKVIL